MKIKFAKDYFLNYKIIFTALFEVFVGEYKNNPFYKYPFITIINSIVLVLFISAAILGLDLLENDNE